MIFVAERYNLWTSPPPTTKTMRANGITKEIEGRLRNTTTAVEPTDISGRLKPFDVKVTNVGDII